MTKVLILSDSHGLTDELSEIKARHQVDYRIHCGDSELDIDAGSLEGFYKVAGNCDFDNRYPGEQVLELGGLKFLVVHGHLHKVNHGLMTLSLRAKEVNADVICFGHTHQAGVVSEGEQLFINPGSILQPRGNIKEKTYAILTWNSIDDLTVKFYKLNGEPYEALGYSTK
ncbi:metallophosphoesterase [Oceanobacillus luteolus]|uniref:Phosphoesterase n=1 Tax=Oceanobacillus luteolus TaxID=1274358 RepID=A0ABW4HSI3_9BACI|nr:metallophosphoesterase [Oceanobacillus luteolus]MCM3739930.1 metallophosphoesterase [Oceanobacillus luteolus]